MTDSNDPTVKVTRAHLGDLTPDPDNARRHNPRGIGMIQDSLQTIGAWRSIAIDDENVIQAGNGAWEAAAQAGIEDVIIVDAPGNALVAVRRTGLTDEQKTLYALYDNRTSELSEWEPNQLLANAELIDLSSLFYDEEVAKLLKQAERERRLAHTVFEARDRDGEFGESFGGDDSDETERDAGDGYGRSAAPTANRTQKTFPLAIVLDRASYNAWEAYKGTLGLRDDSTAFRRLFQHVAMQQAEDDSED